MTSVIVPVPSGGLSTISLDMEVGQTYLSDRQYRRYTKSFNLNEIACPTFGFGDPFVTTSWFTWTTSGTVSSSYLTRRIATMGPPWNPYIIPPNEVMSAHPVWAEACMYLADSNNYFVAKFPIFDPPITLHPVKILDPHTEPTRDPPIPNPPTSKTSHSAALSTASSLDPNPPGGGGGNNGGGGSNNGGNNEPDPGRNGNGNNDPNSNPPRPGSRLTAIPQTTIPLPRPTSNAPSDQADHADPFDPADPAGQSYPSSPWQTVTNTDGSFASGVVMTTNGMTITALNPTAIVMDGTTLTPGAAAITRDGRTYSVSSAGEEGAGGLVIGDVNEGGSSRIPDGSEGGGGNGVDNSNGSRRHGIVLSWLFGVMMFMMIL